MFFNKRIQAAKIGYIVMSAMLCVLGIVLAVVPEFSVTLLCRICGILLLLFGIVKIVGYCSKDLYRLAFQYDLAFGILLIVLGGFLIFRTDTMIHVLCVLLGICILEDALLKIQISIDARTFGIRQWWLILAVAVITGVFGLMMVFRPSQSARFLMTLLGVSLVTEGVLNLVTILTAVKIVRKQKPQVIDTEFYEI